MTLSIELTPAQKAKLETVARESGTGPEEYVKRLVEENLLTTENAATIPMETVTLADILAGRIGRLHSHGRRGEKSFADHLADKHAAERQ